MILAGLKASLSGSRQKERSIAVGYFNVGSSIGAMIALLWWWAIVIQLADGVYYLWRTELCLKAWLVFYKQFRVTRKTV